MKIYDCFTFFNEIELLNFRLNYYKDIVDYFVIVEANQTFKGNKKEKNFNLDLVDKDLREKIRYFYIDIPSPESLPVPFIYEAENLSNWKREEFQRNYLINGLNDADDNDIIILGDIDEFVNKDILFDKNILSLLDQYTKITPILHLFFFSVNGYFPNEQWIHSKILKKKTLMNSSMNIARFSPSQIQIQDAGWHFTSFGGVQRIESKINNFSHSYSFSDKEKEQVKNNECFLRNGTKLVSFTKNLPDLIFEDRYKNFFLNRE